MRHHVLVEFCRAGLTLVTCSEHYAPKTQSQIGLHSEAEQCIRRLKARCSLFRIGYDRLEEVDRLLLACRRLNWT